jgi:hypothetical protein
MLFSFSFRLYDSCETATTRSLRRGAEADGAPRRVKDCNSPLSKAASFARPPVQTGDLRACFRGFPSDLCRRSRSFHSASGRSGDTEHGPFPHSPMLRWFVLPMGRSNFIHVVSIVPGRAPAVLFQALEQSQLSLSLSLSPTFKSRFSSPSLLSGHVCRTKEHVELFTELSELEKVVEQLQRR